MGTRLFSLERASLDKDFLHNFLNDTSGTPVPLLYQLKPYVLVLHIEEHDRIESR